MKKMKSNKAENFSTITVLLQPNHEKNVLCLYPQEQRLGGEPGVPCHLAIMRHTWLVWHRTGPNGRYKWLPCLVLTRLLHTPRVTGQHWRILTFTTNPKQQEINRFPKQNSKNV